MSSDFILLLGDEVGNLHLDQVVAVSSSSECHINLAQVGAIGALGTPREEVGFDSWCCCRDLCPFYGWDLGFGVGWSLLNYMESKLSLHDKCSRWEAPLIIKFMVNPNLIQSRPIDRSALV